MANPQKENGHLDLANEIVDALCKLHLSGYQSMVLFCILRRTYGWQKKADHISYTQFYEYTGLKDIRHVGRTLKELKSRQIITITKNGHGNVYSFQKDYELWDKLLPKMATPELATPITATPELATPKTTHAIAKNGNAAIAKNGNAAIAKNGKDNNQLKPVNKTTTTNNREKDVVVVGLDFISLYEKNFGLLLPTNKEHLLQMANNYGKELLYKAIDEAIKKENKSIKYIEGIIKNMAMDIEWEATRK